MQTWALVAARMGSSRLPGKSMADLVGAPTLEWICRRAAAAAAVDGVVVATSDEAADAPIRDWANSAGIPCHAGPLHNVLARTARAAAVVEADRLVFINGDSPLTDHRIIDDAVRLADSSGAAYVSSLHGGGGYPDGFSIEVFGRADLEAVARAADNDPAAQEHVTLPFYANGSPYTVLGMTPPVAPPPHLHLSLDTAGDLALITAVYETLLPADPLFGYADVLALLDRDNELLARATIA